MSGHSKFANIKHKKEKNDAAKGKIFTIIGREIAVAVKEGGPDPANNSKLKRGNCKGKGEQYAKRYNREWYQKGCRRRQFRKLCTATYEGYGPTGTAIIVKCLNR